MIHALLKLPGTRPLPGTKPAISLMYADSWGFPGGSVVKNLSASAGDIRDVVLICGSVRKLSAEDLMLLNCGVGEDS